MIFSNLTSYIDEISRRGQLKVIETEVDPYLEIAEIHRRVISNSGPVLLFKNVKGSKFPVVTNLFGTPERVALAFGSEPQEFVETAVRLVHEAMPPTLGKLWGFKSFFQKALKVGIKQSASPDVLSCKQSQVDLDALPIITSWPEDGGPFVTLPLVYTEHPETGIHNMGMYRIQRFDKQTTGLHLQIAKGSGFHLHRAGELGKKLPVHIFLGGPPAATLAAICPLPENVPELIFASLTLGKRFPLSKNPALSMPVISDAEFCLVGYSTPDERRPEGPFGDHYGYYSLTHDFPVFHCTAVYHKKDAIYPATVVGKPKQEDLYLGDYLQKTLSPLFPLVMPGVKKLWSYGETGYHSLSSAVVTERYKKECMVSGFRILGEGQLSLTKFLLLADDDSLDLEDFKSVLTYILRRSDFQTDLHVFSNLAMDTLDYTGPKLNEGSKGVLLGVGEPIRELPTSLPASFIPVIKDARMFSPGCLCVQGASYEANKALPQEVAKDPGLSRWPLVILVDDAQKAASSSEEFLWQVFTRFEPAADIFASSVESVRFHHKLTPPIVIDARMKPWYPGEVIPRHDTVELVNSRWGDYGL